MLHDAYVIENETDSNLLWSNAWGWTDGDDFDVFTFEERAEFDLPIEGKWIQFVHRF
jgi:hypothetical protein